MPTRGFYLTKCGLKLFFLGQIKIDPPPVERNGEPNEKERENNVFGEIRCRVTTRSLKSRDRSPFHLGFRSPKRRHSLSLSD